MKGIIFTEFLDMVEQRFSPQVVEQMVTAAQLPSGGAYTSVGKYDHGEIWSLVCELSKVCDTSVPDLFKAYGEIPVLAAGQQLRAAIDRHELRIRRAAGAGRRDSWGGAPSVSGCRAAAFRRHRALGR